MFSSDGFEKMKNTLTISITKYYTFKTDATDMSLAFDEYQNTTTEKIKQKEITVEPVAFSVWKQKKRKH